VPIQQWEFDVPQPERLPNLESKTSIHEVASEIVHEIRRGLQLCCHLEDFKNFTVEGPQQFHRIVYCITVDKPLFDRFYNSRYGYRAAYFCDPFEGLRANHLLLSLVTPALTESPVTYDCGVSQILVRESLMSLSAKAWLAEKDKDKEHCELCRGEWSNASARSGEIRNDRWENAQSFARWGSAAPYFTKIKVVGAFLRESSAVINGFEEIVPAAKRSRAKEIYESGWS
jgi:hypothetical protein